jgi:hypothetical protein
MKGSPNVVDLSGVGVGGGAAAVGKPKGPGPVISISDDDSDDAVEQVLVVFPGACVRRRARRTLLYPSVCTC